MNHERVKVVREFSVGPAVEWTVTVDDELAARITVAPWWAGRGDELLKATAKAIKTARDGAK